MLCPSVFLQPRIKFAAGVWKREGREKERDVWILESKPKMGAELGWAGSDKNWLERDEGGAT